MVIYNLLCAQCGKNFTRPSNYKKRNKPFCSQNCVNIWKFKQIEVVCQWCNATFFKRPSEIKKTKNNFCNKSCAASFNNTKKRKSRRSKCEKLLFELLREEFPKLEILPNDKTLLNGYETDIAIPSINLAIEWNGIVHFKPIYGENKLQKIQEIDNKKLEIANKQNINLIVIPDLVSKETYVKEAFLKIKNIILTLRRQ